MASVKCRFCGAALSGEVSRCPSCGAPASLRSHLGPKDLENLSHYIQSVENTLLNAKKKADGKIALAFLALVLIWMASSYTLYHLRAEETVIVILFSILMGFVLFIVFGFFVGSLERKSMESLFNRKLKSDIKEYLSLMEYTSTDFKVAAGLILTEKSCLNDFLADI